MLSPAKRPVDLGTAGNQWLMLLDSFVDTSMSDSEARLPWHTNWRVSSAAPRPEVDCPLAACHLVSGLREGNRMLKCGTGELNLAFSRPRALAEVLCTQTCCAHPAA